jgi:hypothetical protein
VDVCAGVEARVVEPDLLVDASTPELPDGSARAGQVLDEIRQALLLSVVSSLRS